MRLHTGQVSTIAGLDVGFRNACNINDNDLKPICARVMFWRKEFHSTNVGLGTCRWGMQEVLAVFEKWGKLKQCLLHRWGLEEQFSLDALERASFHFPLFSCFFLLAFVLKIKMMPFFFLLAPLAFSLLSVSRSYSSCLTLIPFLTSTSLSLQSAFSDPSIQPS